MSVLKEKVSTLSKRNVILEEQVSGDVTEIEEKDSKIEELQAEIQTLNETIFDLNNQINSLSEAFSSVATERDGIKDQLSELLEKSNSDEVNLKELKIMLGNYQSEVEKNQEQLKDYAGRVSIYRSALIQLAKEIG